MSWITGLADKAENILNKIDKNAATALQVPANVSSSPSSMTSSTTVLQGMPLTKKSFSSSSLSLKSSLSSPSKLSKAMDKASVQSEGPAGLEATDSLEPTTKLEWHINPNMTSSRRSSISSKSDAVSIKIGVDSDLKEVSTDSVLEIAKNNTFNSGDNQELAAFKIALAEITSERDELRLRLNALNRDVENASLRQRHQELEMLVLSLTEERDQAQGELLESQKASSAYVYSISELESNLAKLQQDYIEVARKLQMQINETAQQQQELQDYRTKAQRALQMKDNLIAELKANAGGAGGTESDNNEVVVLQMEINSLKQEHQNIQQENMKLLQKLEESRLEMSSLEKHHSEILATFHANEDTMRREMRLEKERSMQLESEQRVLMQELTTLREQLSKQVAAAATRLQEKDLLCEQMKTVHAGSASSQELANYDMRIKSLTQALVDKQNAVENITADRNALRLQLEKVQDQLQRSIYQSNKNVSSPHSNVLLSNTTDDVKAQYPLLMKENPFDNRVARRVKRAYSSLDSAGIRLGAFLRRYPLMRVFVLMYVGLLHMWVMFVLLSSTPT